MNTLVGGGGTASSCSLVILSVCLSWFCCCFAPVKSDLEEVAFVAGGLCELGTSFDSWLGPALWLMLRNPPSEPLKELDSWRTLGRRLAWGAALGGTNVLNKSCPRCGSFEASCNEEALEIGESLGTSNESIG